MFSLSRRKGRRRTGGSTTVVKPDITLLGLNENGKPRMSWSASDTAISAYKIYRSTKSNFQTYETYTIKNTKTTTYTHTSAVIDTTYYYRVSFVYANGNESPYSRYDMSMKIADQLKQYLNIDKFDTVVLTDGETFANALSGSYLAKVNNAPLLFVDFEDIKQSIDYLSENLVDKGNVYIIGEIPGLTDKSLNEFNNYSITRIEGNNIYEVNLNALKYTGINTEKILVCTGENFADSISAIATGLPIILVRDTLSDSQLEFISHQKEKEFCIIGGTIAVNEFIEEELKKYGQVVRIKGRTRYDTSAVIAYEFFNNATSAVITSGKILTDGFCSGVYAAHIGCPMLLANRGNTDAANSYVTSKNIKFGIVIGGENVVGNLTANGIFNIEKKEEE